MVEQDNHAPSEMALLRGRIRRQLINRMQNGEVLIVSDFESLLDLGAEVEALPRFTPKTATGRYKDETLFFDRSVSPIRFEETVARIDEQIAS